MRAARTTRSPLLLASLATLALTLGGCSGSAGGDGTVTAEASDGTGADDASGDTRDKGTTSPDTDATTDDAAASEGAACLVGSWVSEGADAAQNLAAVMAASGLDAEISVTGGSVTTFSAGTWTQEFRDQVNDTTWTLDDQELRSVTHYSGAVSGAYTATDQQVVITDVDTSALVLDQTTYINGEALDLPGITDVATGVLEMGGSFTYTCAADELRVVSLDPDGNSSDIASVLHRQ